MRFMDTPSTKATKKTRVPIPVTINTPPRGQPSYRFGPELRSARHSKKLTVLRAAAKIGVDPSFLSRLETGLKGVAVASTEIVKAIEWVYDAKIVLPAVIPPSIQPFTASP